MLSSVGEEEQQQQENRFLVKKKIFKREIMSPTWSFVVVVGATILGSLIGPSQSTVIPLTNQPLSQASSAAHSQAHASSAAGNSRSNPFPAHDPFGRAKVYPGMVPHYPQENGSGQKRRQTLQFTFSPEPQQQMTPGGRLLQNSSTPPLPIIKAAYTPPEVLPFPGAADPSTIIINPANIQWTAPDVPDAVSSEIINKLRLQLGNGPVTLGELNDRLIQFTTTLPNVLVNKTQITTVQETVVEEQKVQEDQKSTRTMAYQQQKKPVSASYKVTTTSSSTSGYDGHPSKTYVSYDKVTPPINSLSYNPAAAVYDSSRSPPYMVGNDYQKSYSEQQYSYQVPSESSYQTNYYQPQPQPQQPSYSKPEVSYSSKPQQQQQPAYQANSAYQQAPPPPPPAYQKAPESYSKPQQQQYQPPPKTDYQKPKAEAYQQQQQQQPPKESYSAPTPPPPPYHQQQKKQQSYTSPSKEENVKIIYKYVEVCNPSSYEKLQPQSPPPPSPPQPSYKPQPQQQPKPQYPNQGQQKPNPYVEVATNLASQYPNSGEPLNLDLASTTSEAAGSAQDSQAALASVYGEIHRRMAELEQLQRYVAQVQAEVQQAAYTPIVIPQIYVPPMPTLSYSSVGPSYLEPQVPSTYYSPAPAPNYPPPPPPPPKPAAAVSYSPPPPPPPPPLPKQQEYKVQQSSYSTPKPQPSYNTPKPQPSYSEPKPQPQQQQSYNSGQPYNGNQMTVQYVKTVEKVSQNATSPAAAY